MSFLSNTLVGIIGGVSLIGASNIGGDLGSFRVYTYLLLYIAFMVFGTKLQAKKQDNIAFKQKFLTGLFIYTIMTLMYFTFEAASSNYFGRITTSQSTTMLVAVIGIGLALSGLIAFLLKKTSG